MHGMEAHGGVSQDADSLVWRVALLTACFSVIVFVALPMDTTNMLGSVLVLARPGTVTAVLQQRALDVQRQAPEQGAGVCCGQFETIDRIRDIASLNPPQQRPKLLLPLLSPKSS
jgi:hypothetical protein